MGLLKGLVLLPLAPVSGVAWIAEQIRTQVDLEMLGPDAILQELARLQAAVDDGLISEEEYLEAETELLDRLEALEEVQ